MLSQRVFLHIGMSKTGSTSLQRGYFPQLEGLRYLGKIYSPEVGKAINYLHMTNSAAFDPDYFVGGLSGERLEDERRPILISEEDFTPARVTDPLCLDRLKLVFPNSRVMLVVRNQIDLAPSAYTEYFFNRPEFSREHYLSWLEATVRPGAGTQLSIYRYDRILAYIEKYYGPEDIGVFQFEELAADFPSFARKLTAFMGIAGPPVDRLPQHHARTTAVTNRKNKALRARYSAIRSAFLPNFQLRRFLPFSAEDAMKRLERNEWSRRAQVDLSIPGDLEAKLRGHFAAGNRLVAGRFGLDHPTYQ